jgi:hypothetical protein
LSRNVLRFLLPGLLALAGGPLLAQQPSTAEQALAEAASAYGPPAPVVECKPGQGEEIVVCAKEQEQSQFRIRSDKQAEDDYASRTMNEGDPRPPDVSGPGIFHGPPTIGGLCFPGLQKCPPPPAIEVDFSQLPEAPPGSDADRIARGLPPLGEDGAEPAPPDR